MENINIKLNKESAWEGILPKWDGSAFESWKCTAGSINQTVSIMLQNSCITENTPREGASRIVSFQYMRALFKQLRTTPLIEHSIEESLLIKIESAIEILEYFHECIEKNSEQIFLSNVFNKIRSQLETESVCYFPCGWMGSKVGHFVILMIEKLDESNLRLSFLNKGEGVDYHMPLLQEGAKLKYDPQSLCVLISKTDFFESGLGAVFICKLANLVSNKTSDCNPHGKEDLYHLLALLGNYNTESQAQRGETIQRSGTCTITSLLIMVRTIFHKENRLDLYKKFIFAVKFFDLARNWSPYIREPKNFLKLDYASRVGLSCGVGELITRIEKHFSGFLQKKEISLALSLANQIVKVLCQPQTPTECEKWPNRQISFEYKKLYSIDSSPRKTPHVSENELIKFKAKHAVPEFHTAESVCEFLKNNSEYYTNIMNKNPESAISALFNIFRNMPLTSGEIEDSFWNKLEPDQMEKLIEDLAIYARLAANIRLSKVYRAVQMEIFARAYDIAAHLFQKIPKLNSEKYYLSLDYHWFMSCHDQFYFYDEFFEKTVLKKIIDNFDSRERRADKLNQKPLFKPEIICREYSNKEKSGMQTYVLSFMETCQSIKQDILDDFYINIKEGIENGNKISTRTQDGNDFLVAAILIAGGGIWKKKTIVPLFEQFTELSNLFHNYYLTDQGQDEEIVLYNKYCYTERDTHILENVVYDNDFIAYLIQNYESENLTFSMGCAYKFKTGEKWYCKGLECPKLFAYNVPYMCPRPNQDSQMEAAWENALFHPKFNPMIHGWTKQFTSDMPSYILPELLRIRSCKSTDRVVRACRWAASNPHLLVYPNVRLALEQLIFQYSTRDNSLDQYKKKALEAIAYFLGEALTFYRTRSPKEEIYCWLSIMTDYFKKYAPKFDPSSIYRSIDPYLKTLLLNRKHQQRAACALLHHLFAKSTPLTQEELLDIFILMPLVNLAPQQDVAMVHVRILLEQNRSSLHQLLNKLGEQELDRLGNQLVSYYQLSIDNSLTQKWVLDEDYLRSSQFAIHLGSLSLYKDNKLLFNFAGLVQSRSWEMYHQVFGLDAPFEGTIGQEFIIRNDNQFALEIEDKGGVVELKNVLMFFEEQWWYYVDKPCNEYLNDPFNEYLHNPLKSKDYHHWISINTLELLITDGSNHPYIVERKGKLEFLTDKNKGKVLASDYTWKERLSRYENSDEILFEGEEDKSTYFRRIKLERIEMTRLGLSWKFTEEELVSEQFEGAIWQDVLAPYLNGFKGAFFVKDQENELVIIPRWQFKKLVESIAFEKDLQLVRTLIESKGQQGAYFVYKVNHATEQLESELIEANLYLALIYRAQKDYLRAIKALRAAFSNERPSQLAHDIFEQAFKQEENSANGCAFDCQLIDYFLNSWNLLTHSGLSKDDQINNFDKEFETFVQRRYSRYKNRKSSMRQEVNAISDYLRLSSTQEMRINELFSVEKIDFEPYLLPWEIIRNDKSEIENKENTITFPKQLGFTRLKDVPFGEQVTLVETMQNNNLNNKKIALMHMHSVYRSGELRVHQKNVFCKTIIESYNKKEWFNTKAPVQMNNLQKKDSLGPPPSREVKGFKIELKIEIDTLYLKELSKYFTATAETISKSEELLLKSSNDRMVKKLVEDLTEGHRSNRQNKRDYYELQIDLSDLKIKLQKSEKQLKVRIENLKIDLLALLRHTSEDERGAIVGLAWKLKSRSCPDIGDLVELLYTRESSSLLSKNPCLDEKCINQVTHQFLVMMSLEVELSQITQVLREIGDKENLEPALQHKIGSLIYQRRHYQIQEYPELLVYEWEEGKILRSFQGVSIKNIVDAVKNKQFVDMQLEIPAGGGKSKLVIPNLKNLIARLGFLPVVTTANSLYTITKGDMTLELLEIDIDDPLSSKTLKNIYCALDLWKKEHKGVLMQSETWDALYLGCLEAYAIEDKDRIKIFEKILIFFKTQCIRMSDECHQSDSPLMETIRAFGQGQKIPLMQRQLIIDVYHSIDNHTRALQEGTLILLDEKAREELIQKLKIDVADKLFVLIEKHFRGYKKEAITEYLGSLPGSKRPEWLYAIYRKDKELANLVILAKSLFTTFLPHIFEVRTTIDVGKSIHKGDLTAAPKSDTRGLRSHFAEHTKLMALTAQEAFRLGLDKDQMKLVLEGLLHKIDEERKEKEGLTQKMWEEIFQGINPCAINIGSEEFIDKIVKSHHKNKQLISYYLLYHALDQVEVPKTQFSVTPAERSAGFLMNIYLSATCGIKELYPVGLGPKNITQDKAFAAEVFEALCDERNSKICEIREEQNSLIQSINYLCEEGCSIFIDRGGTLRNVKNKKFSSELFARHNGKYTAVLQFFQSPQFEEKLIFERPNGQKVALKGTNLSVALKKQGIEYEKERDFKRLNIDKTVGTDFVLPLNAIGGLSVGAKQTLTETIQAAMRLRQLLIKNGQRVIWLVDTKILNKLPEKKVSELLWMMILKEAEQFKTAIHIRALQGIRALIKEFVLQQIRESKKKYSECSGVFEDKVSIEPWEIYELETEKQKTDVVLKGVALGYYRRAGYQAKTFDDIKGPDLKKLDTIIKETSQFLDKLESAQEKMVGQKLNQQMVKHNHAEQDTVKDINKDMQQRSDIVNNPGQALWEDGPGNGDFGKWLEKKFLPINECLPDVFGQLKVPPLLFNKNNYFVITDKDLLVIKPIWSIMVFFHEGTWKFYALSSCMHSHCIYSQLDNWYIFDENGKKLAKSKNFNYKNKYSTTDLEKVVLFSSLLRGEGNFKDEKVNLLKELNWKSSDVTMLRNWLILLCTPQQRPIDVPGLQAIEDSLRLSEREKNVIKENPRIEINKPEREKNIIKENPNIDKSDNKNGLIEINIELPPQNQLLVNRKKWQCLSLKTAGVTAIFIVEIAAVGFGILALLASLNYPLGVMGTALAHAKILGSGFWIGGAFIVIAVTGVAVGKHRHKQNLDFVQNNN